MKHHPLAYVLSILIGAQIPLWAVVAQLYFCN